MSDVSITDLITPVTVDEAKSSIYGVLADLGVPTTSWKTGAVVRTLIHMSAVCLAGASRVVSLVAKSGLRSEAEEEWLTLLAREIYGVERITETFATGEVTLINAGGGVYTDLAPGDIVVENTVTGKTYTNTETVSIAALSSVDIDIQAIEEGTGSNAAAGQITTLVTTFTGVTCTNATALIATDEETDDALRSRCDDKLDSLSPNGAAGAYSYVARAALRPDGSSVGVTRVSTSAVSSTGVLTTTVATATGALGSTDLGYVDDAIQETCVPLGVTCTVQSAVAKTVPVVATAYIYNNDGRTTAQIQAEVLSRLGDWVSTRPIGGDIIPGGTLGYVDTSALTGEIKSVSKYCYKVALSTPSANISIASNEVPILGTVNLTVVWTEPKK